MRARKKTDKCIALSYRDCCDILRQMSKQHKFKITNEIREGIHESYYSPVLVGPFVLDIPDKGRLWFDRYFIAFQPDMEEVRYYYLTRAFMNSECYTFKLRGLRIPDWERHQFVHARLCCGYTGENVWVDKDIVLLRQPGDRACYDASNLHELREQRTALYMPGLL